MISTEPQICIDNEWECWCCKYKGKKKCPFNKYLINKEKKNMSKKSDKALKIFMDILKWITIIPGLVSLIMNKIKEK